MKKRDWKWFTCGVLMGAALMALGCEHCERKAAKRAGGNK